MDDTDRNNVLIMADRLARLYYWTVQTLIDEFGEVKAKEAVKKIIFNYGIETGKMAREAVEAKGLAVTIDNYSQSGDLPTVGWEGKTLEASPDKLITDTTFCPFADVWKKRYPGFEKWARLYCFIDQAKFKSYDPACECITETNVLDGCESCRVKTFK